MQIESTWWDEEHMCMVVTAQMPSRVDGSVALAPDDTEDCFVMFLNANKIDTQRKRAYRHECGHIENDDLYSSASVQAIECQTHGKAG